MAASNEMYTFGHDNHEAAEEIEDEIFDSQGSRSKIKDLILKRIPLTAYPGTGSSVWKSTRGVAACLGLLSILLMAGVIGLVVYYNREMDSFKENINLIVSNSTNEQQQFQTRYNEMTEERDQCQTRYNEMTKERDQFEIRFNNLTETEERDRCQTRYNAMTRERDQFQTRYNAMTRGRDQFQTRYNAMTRERDQCLVVRDNPKANLSLVDQHLQQGWLYYNSGLYFISNEMKTWEDSRRDCVGKNADLLIIKSTEEQVYLHGLNNEVFWIGLTYKEGKWMWVDDTELTTGYWRKGQPNNANDIDEDCVARWSSQPAAENSWHDAPCNELHYWMCEKKVE